MNKKGFIQVKSVFWGLHGLAVLGAVIWVIGAGLGVLHPLGDSLAVFVVPVAAMGAVLAVMRWRWTLVLFVPVLALRVWAAVPGPVPEEVTLVLYQKNLLFSATRQDAIVRDVLVSDADVATFQEVSIANLPILEALRDAYPHQHICSGGRAVGGVAIVSRWPMTPRPCEARFGLADVDVAGPDGPLRVVSLHLHWPYPFGQAQHVTAITQALGAPSTAPTVVAGDFNMVPWGHSLRRIAMATGTRWVRPVRWSYNLYSVQFAIDHVLIGPDMRMETELRPKLGSDHAGVLARIGF